jgi:hypothetical protein
MKEADVPAVVPDLAPLDGNTVGTDTEVVPDQESHCKFWLVTKEELIYSHL